MGLSIDTCSMEDEKCGDTPMLSVARASSIVNVTRALLSVSMGALVPWSRSIVSNVRMNSTTRWKASMSSPLSSVVCCRNT